MPLQPKRSGRIDRLAHGPPEADALFQLQRNRFGDELGIELGLMHFLNIDMHLARRLLLQILLQLVDFRALRPMMIPGRAVLMMMRSLLPGRSISTALTPADLSFSFSSVLSL